MNNIRKIFRRLRTLLWTSLTIVTVLAAVLVGIGKLLMPYSDYYEPQLESWLSKAFNQPVTVESFEGEWKAFGPRISFQGLTFTSDGRPGIAIQTAALDVKPLNVLIPGRPLYSFRIIGANLSLVRTVDGRYLLSGLGVSNNGAETNSQLRNVALNGEVLLEESSLSFDDPEREVHVLLTSVNGRLKMDGDRLATEVKARISDKTRRRVVGDLEAVIRVKLDGKQRLSEAVWHVKTGELILAELVRQLPHHPLVPVSGRFNAELWGEWQHGSDQHMQGVLDLRNAELTSQSGPLLIDHLNSRFNWRFTHKRDWQIDLADFSIVQGGVNWQTPRLTVARNVPEDLGLWISADLLRLDFPVQLTQRILASYKTIWPAAIPSRAQGKVNDFDLLLDAKWRLKHLHAQLEDGHFWGLQNGPEISGINAQVKLASDGGNVKFGGQNFKMDWQRVFRRQLALELKDCDADVMLGANKAWQFDLTYCHLENADIGGYGRLRMASSEGKPEIDINAVMEHGDISRFGDYWPENVMSERTLRWLRTSLLSGQVTNGRYSLYGDLDDFPFRDHSGVSQAVAPVSDAELRYAEQWPLVSQINASAEFIGAGMYVDGSVGDTAGAKVDRVSAQIGDFKKPLLDITYQTTTDLAQLAGFIKQTSLLDTLALDAEQFALSGASSRVMGHVLTPLGADTDELKVTGSVKLEDARFLDRVTDIELTGIQGELYYSREGLHADGLVAQFHQYPVVLDVVADWLAGQTASKAASQPAGQAAGRAAGQHAEGTAAGAAAGEVAEVFRASMRGELPVAAVVPQKLLQSEPLFSRASGVSPWDISLHVGAKDDQLHSNIWVQLDSTLIGTAFDLPAPLNKPVYAFWPLHVKYPIRSDDQLLTASIPGKLNLQMQLNDATAAPERAVLQLGAGTGQLPAAGLFTFSGSVAMLDLDEWLDLIIGHFKRNKGTDGLSLHGAFVSAAQIKLFDRLFDDVDMSMSYADGIVDGVFDGADIAGKVRYYKNEEGTHSLTAEFERLIVPDPVSSGVSMNTNPAELPELRFFSKQFSYLGLPLGVTRMEGYPVKNGFRVDSIETNSPELEFSASGDWLKDTEGERSDFDIRISSESLGTVLKAMDVSSAMSGGQTLVNFDAWWVGPPAAFALDRLNGEIDFSIIQGNILTAKPGAGRMLGLFSLSELPRRLAMDFRDVFDEGFSFDEAKGTMQLENGTSYTNDLILSSTAAEIAITGSTDLAAKTFNYDVSVRPGVSKALPVIGAIAGGPVGVAAGLALQALLRDSLGEAAEARYTIRGPWSDPQVEPVAKSNSKDNSDTQGAATESAADKTIKQTSTGEENNG